jgi:hypothetical protein
VGIRPYLCLLFQFLQFLFPRAAIAFRLFLGRTQVYDRIFEGLLVSDPNDAFSFKGLLLFAQFDVNFSKLFSALLRSFL